jgi:modulator of FtsH protease HflK
VSGPSPQNPDPWKKKDQGGPPFLEDIIRDWLKKFSFTGKGFSSSSSRNGGSEMLQGFGAFAIVFLIFYVLMGIYIVAPAEKAVIQRFGQYVRMVGPGPHWYPRMIEKKTMVNVKEMHANQHSALMLTRDENIVDVEIVVQYTKANPEQYLFNIYHPDETLKQVSDSALRYVIGHSTLDEVLTSGRSEIAARIRKQVAETMAEYQSGIEIDDVVMQPARAPREVKEAFDDVIRAQEDEFRLINEADAYAKRIYPIAEGHAKRLLEDAGAYHKKVISLSTGEAQRFNDLLPQYQAFPGVLRDRLYLKTLTEVFSNTTKVLVDSELGNQLLVLPLDKIFGNNAEARSDKVEGLTMADTIRSAPEPEEENLSSAARFMKRPVREEGE